MLSPFEKRRRSEELGKTTTDVGLGEVDSVMPLASGHDFLVQKAGFKP